MAKTKTFEGKKIREVWDFRLSYASPVLYNSGAFWVIHIYANNPHHDAWKDHPGREETNGNVRVLLEEIVTDIPTLPNGDPKERMTPEAIKAGQQACYPILYKVREKYTRDNFELRKPVVKLINESNAECGRLNSEAIEAEQSGDTELAMQKRGEMQGFLQAANANIKQAVTSMKQQIAEGGAA